MSRINPSAGIPSGGPLKRVDAKSPKPVTEAAPANKSTSVSRGKSAASSRDQLLRGFRSLGVDYRQIGMKSDTPLDTRIEKRRLQKLRRQQNNLEHILKLALDYAPARSGHDDLDLDWLENFTTQAQDISNPAMQQLWSRILAAESAKPGSFSLRTLATLRQLTTREADVLRRAQGLTGLDQHHLSYKIITGYYRRPSLFTWLTLDKPTQLNIAKVGISYPDLLTLSDLGVLYPSAIESAEMAKGQTIELQYSGRKLQLVAQRSALVLTYYKFTAQGEELLRLLPPAAPDAYLELIGEHYSRDFAITNS